MNYQPGFVYENSDEKESVSDRMYWFIFKNNKVLFFDKGGNPEIPELIKPEEIGIKRNSELFLGKLDGKNLWCCEASDEREPLNNCCGVTDHGFKSLREWYPLIGEELFSLAGRALQLNNWMKGWQYCPVCTGELLLSQVERAKICRKCGKIHYPVISPAVIVAVSKADELLLAHNNKYPDFNRYSILAGFVEAGETLEETVEREIFEEVRIRVENIRYFGSQSWPFPHSLMIGFTADYKSGEIEVDNIEIGAAFWFKASELPLIPPHGSISRVLIDDFVRRNTL